MVHPRYSAREDMGKVSPIFYAIPEIVLEKLIPKFSPIKAGKVKFIGGDDVIGWIVWIPLLGKQMLNFPRDFVVKKIIDGIEMVKDAGARIVGLGEFTASVTHGGRDLVGKVPGVNLTSGNSLTTGVVFRVATELMAKNNFDERNGKIAVIGAAGSIGRGVSSLLLERGLSVILVDRPKKLADLRASFTDGGAQITDDVAKIKEAGVIICTTSSTEQILNPGIIGPNAIIYDITQPRNTSPLLKAKRPDISIIDGGLVDTPLIDFGVNIGLKKSQAYACLAETVLLAMEDASEDYVGFTTPESAKKMLALMDKHADQFKINIRQSFGAIAD